MYADACMCEFAFVDYYPRYRYYYPMITVLFIIQENVDILIKAQLFYIILLENDYTLAKV